MEDQERHEQPEVTEAPSKSKKKSPITSIITTLIVIAIAGAAGFFLLGGKDDNNKTVNTDNSSSQTTSSNENEEQSPAAGSDRASAPTKEQVALHDKSSDCWTIVEGVVYDITEYVPKHPGGDEILKACGADGTTLFTERKTASGEKVGSGTPHSSRAESMLKEYEVGKLAN